MEQKIYKADEELAEILKKNGFKEFSKGNNSRKRLFKLERQSRKSIRFDYINIEICINGGIYLGQPTITGDDLSTILFFLKLKTSMIEKLHLPSGFSIRNINESIKSMSDQINFYNSQETYPGQIKLLIKIIEAYDLERVAVGK